MREVTTIATDSTGCYDANSQAEKKPVEPDPTNIGVGI
ncbi:hypothetical protein M992_0093 [Moellerella wisconsensis ATCC 35017]|uniref:Uncharacterized protein n=1 Tax=Moellerella wisconsensis ATCC 35017 TaxID=1354267 RepID=A0A0N0ZA91_9GAMM|nr:hypothetical protein M992_0093 [Moellerella wisconsensis ATCC 35017]